MRRFIVLVATFLFMLPMPALASPHGEERDGCDHGATSRTCRPDPQPDRGKDCKKHGKHGGVNEDHCTPTSTTTTTTTPPTSTTTTTTITTKPTTPTTSTSPSPVATSSPTTTTTTSRDVAPTPTLGTPTPTAPAPMVPIRGELPVTGNQTYAVLGLLLVGLGLSLVWLSNKDR